MVFKETSVFTRQALALLTSEEYRGLQIELAAHPHIGSVIRGSGGLRKLRWARQGRGKRGGVRLIYYWAVQQSQIVLLLLYPKSEQDGLAPRQLAALKKLIETEYP